MKNKEVAALLELTNGGTSDIDELLKGVEAEWARQRGPAFVPHDDVLRQEAPHAVVHPIGVIKACLRRPVADRPSILSGVAMRAFVVGGTNSATSISKLQAPWYRTLGERPGDEPPPTASRRLFGFFQIFSDFFPDFLSRERSIIRSISTSILGVRNWEAAKPPGDVGSNRASSPHTK